MEVKIYQCPDCGGTWFSIFDVPDGQDWETKFKCSECDLIMKPNEVVEVDAVINDTK